MSDEAKYWEEAAEDWRVKAHKATERAQEAEAAARAMATAIKEVEALRAENARLRETAARMGRQLLRSDDDL